LFHHHQLWVSQALRALVWVVGPQWVWGWMWSMTLLSVAM
jgi:hypothetical protein